MILATSSGDNIMSTASALPEGNIEATEDNIYDSIKHAVLTQRLASGSRLPELTLSKVYHVNRTVVRRALERLGVDGIVELKRNQSATVVSPGAEETRQLFAARRCIEAEVVRQTAGNLDATARNLLEKVVSDELRAHVEHIEDDRIHLSLRFHECLADVCPNQVLGRILKDLVLRTSVAVALYKVPGMAACYRSSDHQDISAALLSGDCDAAADAAVRHLDYLEERLNYARHIHQGDLASILGS